MPGTRTAPTVDGLPLYKIASFRWMDFTSDIRTDSYQILAAATDAQVEALAVALQAASNSTLYEIKVAADYVSVPDGNNALEEVWENVNDNLVIQAKKPTQESIRCYVPSPVESMFIDQTDDIDPANASLVAILTAFTAVIDPTFEVVGARFTVRRDINQQIKF